MARDEMPPISTDIRSGRSPGNRIERATQTAKKGIVKKECLPNRWGVLESLIQTA
jgi:hypothetical protein